MTQLNELSNREKEVVNLLLEGKSNKLIAASLHITERTVEFHLKNVYDKFQVSSRVELVLKLGESTVADSGKVAENGDRLNSENSRSQDWRTSLRDAVSLFGKELKMDAVLNANARNEGKRMTFFESIRVCLAKYAEFDGRASRAEFWWFTLFVVLGASALAYLSESVASVFLVAILLPYLAVGARRLHDTGKSGWWQLFHLVPVAGFAIVWILCAAPTLPQDAVQA